MAARRLANGPARIHGADTHHASIDSRPDFARVVPVMKSPTNSLRWRAHPPEYRCADVQRPIHELITSI